MKKKIPKFESEDQEREFWSNQDSTEYLDWGKAKRLSFPNLKPSTKTISIRLPESMLEDLKILANKRDVPYQSLLKVFLAETHQGRTQIERSADQQMNLTNSYATGLPNLCKSPWHQCFKHFHPSL